MGAIYKYRDLLGEVLLASFFLQIFALVTPLFFQIVIDKVLVHRSMTTLDVLLIGLSVAVVRDACWAACAPTCSRTRPTASTSSLARACSAISSRCRSLISRARRVGDSVARVRELENIRKFLTSSALTLVIDLFFTVVFLAVMFFYSPLLTLIVLARFRSISGSRSS